MPRDRHRPVWARAFGRGHFPHQLSWLIDNPVRGFFITPSKLADRLPLTESSDVLEVGPGSGYFSVELAKRLPKGSLALLDLQPEMLAKAKRKLARSGFQNVSFTVQDAGERLPYGNDSFDVVVLVAVLGEVRGIESCLLELMRVLRPSGVVAVHEHAPDPDRIPFRDLQLLMKRSGFRFCARQGLRWNYTATFTPAGT